LISSHDNSLREVFVVIRSYVDESVGRNDTFALGCAVAKGMEWTWINQDWKKCLERKNRYLKREGRKCISRYHASDCESRQGEFAGWDVPEKNQFVAELISIINRHHLHIVGFTVDKTDVSELFPQVAKECIDKECYAALAWLLFPEILRESCRLDPRPAVKIVYEQGDVSRHMVNTFDRWRASHRAGELFDSVEKDTWKVLPLQVADLVAFEAMKDRDNQRDEIKRARRLSLKVLLGDKRHGGGRGFHLGRDGLQRVAEVVARSA
jgi:hypothetical protein